mgnify:FL=1
MEYIKLIALKVDDLSSSISFENNYGIDDMEMVNDDKNCLENDGCVCVVLKLASDLKI